MYAKTAQLYGNTDMSLLGGMAGRTLADLYQQIMMDPGLQANERYEAIEQIRTMANNAPPSTPLSALLAGGLGGILGYLISKYFKMNTLGQAVSAVMGYGLGRQVNTFLNQQRQMGIY